MCIFLWKNIVYIYFMKIYRVCIYFMKKYYIYICLFLKFLLLLEECRLQIDNLFLSSTRIYTESVTMLWHSRHSINICCLNILKYLKKQYFYNVIFYNVTVKMTKNSFVDRFIIFWKWRVEIIFPCQPLWL